MRAPLIKMTTKCSSDHDDLSIMMIAHNMLLAQCATGI